MLNSTFRVYPLPFLPLKSQEFLAIIKNEIPLLEYDERGFGKDSHEKALLLGLEILRNFT
jgi:hypothetical protein